VYLGETFKKRVHDWAETDPEAVFLDILAELSTSSSPAFSYFLLGTLTVAAFERANASPIITSYFSSMGRERNTEAIVACMHVVGLCGRVWDTNPPAKKGKG
jgi:hypothetical protein